MKVIYVCGSWSTEALVGAFYDRLGQELEQRNKGVQFRYYFDSYQPYETGRVKAIGDKIIRENDDGTDVILAGYSVGGILAKDLIDKFKRSKIKGLVTVFCPNNLTWILGYRNNKHKNYIDLIDPLDPLSCIFFTFNPMRNQKIIGPYLHGADWRSERLRGKIIEAIEGRLRNAE